MNPLLTAAQEFLGLSRPSPTIVTSPARTPVAPAAAAPAVPSGQFGPASLGAIPLPAVGASPETLALTRRILADLVDTIERDVRIMRTFSAPAADIKAHIAVADRLSVTVARLAVPA